jgi:4-amino-4-deoxy-L-arabinose transferase-like glycosyltransferase
VTPARSLPAEPVDWSPPERTATVSPRAQTAAVFAAVVLLRLALAALLPIVQDETYYLGWARVPDWGYFDHPPFVAWMSSTALLAWGSPLAGRLGTMALAAAAFPFAAGLLLHAGVRERAAYLAGLLLSSFNLCAVVAGVLTTPDAALLTAWCAALHEAAAALTVRRARWVGAGLAVGLGLLAKYNMVLIGPVFAWALWRGDRAALRTPWPWIGAFVAGLVFAPHIAWNAQHAWVPIRFQLHHGFEGAEDGVALTTRLPSAQAPSSAERAFGRRFKPWDAKSDAFNPSTGMGERLASRVANYVKDVLLIWGAFLVLIVYRVVRRLRRLPRAPDAIDARVRPLLIAAMVVPLAFFALVSLRSHVQANWPAVYVVGAAPLLATFCARRLRLTVGLAALNAALLLALAAYVRAPFGCRAEARIVREVQGYRELAALLDARLEGPVFGDRHQLVAELNFHAPRLALQQWPGIGRPSEYLRRPEWNRHTVESLTAAGGLWLVAERPMPPRLPGFTPVNGFVAYYCLGSGLVTIDAFTGDEFHAPCPGRTVHRWLVVRYVPEASAST